MRCVAYQKRLLATGFLLHSLDTANRDAQNPTTAQTPNFFLSSRRLYVAAMDRLTGFVTSFAVSLSCPHNPASWGQTWPPTIELTAKTISIEKNCRAIRGVVGRMPSSVLCFTGTLSELRIASLVRRCAALSALLTLLSTESNNN